LYGKSKREMIGLSTLFWSLFSSFFECIGKDHRHRVEYAMPEALSIKAPAKINLHLAVGALRNDGFHDLVSIFQAISIYDELEVWLDDSGKVKLECEVDCHPERNTMYRAASLCLSHARRQGLSPDVGVGIRARKGIPSGAGLGGGSSDAAAVIKAMSIFHPLYYSGQIKAALAAEVGSDVPFFLGSACALVGGRGELLEGLEPRTDYSILVVYPGFSIQTAYAFRGLDAYRARSDGHQGADEGSDWTSATRTALSKAYLSLEPASWPFTNDFFNSLVEAYPELVRCRDLLLGSGADFAALSGSGSTVFGVFKASETRERAFLALSEGGFRPMRAFPLARLPDSD
jgi:4-diphosphocytidyl-2-C-methyl-D-erythritol kinase